MKTFVGKQEQAKGEWFLVDASNQVLGRLASRIVRILIGKHRPSYTPHVDSGDHVVVVNAGAIKLTGTKFDTKTYYRHSTLPGSLKARTYRQLVAKFPTRPLELAVRRMLPKNRLRARRIRRLHVYLGPNHRHQAQKPKPISLN